MLLRQICGSNRLAVVKNLETNQGVSMELKFVPKSRSHLSVAFLSFTLSLSAFNDSHAAFALIDNFDSYTQGTGLNGQGDWTTPSSFEVGADPTSGSNNVLQANTIFGPSQYGSNDAAAFSIADGTTGTIFFRFRMPVASGVNTSVGGGLTSNPSTFGDFRPQYRIDGTLDPRDGGSFLTGPSLEADVWYDAWLVVDNNLNQSEFYIQGGDFTSQTQVDVGGQTDFAFRSTQGTDGDIQAFYIVKSDTSIGDFFLDDLYLDTLGVNLANPVPEPTTSVLLFAGCAVLFIRRSKRS